MTQRLVVLLVIVAVVLALGGCQAKQTFDSPEAAMAALAGEWTLTEMGEADIEERLPDGVGAPTLVIAEDGAVSGFAGVNRLGSSVDLVDLLEGRFSLAPIALTRMAGPPMLMTLESDYVTALGRAVAYSVDGDDLRLLDGAGEVLEFER